jgi:pyrroline-5-carboxylate reductase
VIKNKKITLVGCGKMGGAMLKGWLSHGVLPNNITIIEPMQDLENYSAKKINVLKSPQNLPEDQDFCIFAVKPQHFEPAVSEYKTLNDNCVFISIAAGKTIAKMETILGYNRRIVRAMPNLPATVMSGLTAVSYNKNINKENKLDVNSLFASIGEVIEIEESKLDIVTAISGSGPAYIFYIIELLNKIGIEQGLKPDEALKLAKHTVFGSGKLTLSTDITPSELREAVTSKGGTTEEALKFLMKDNILENLFRTAIRAAENRSKELSENI